MAKKEDEAEDEDVEYRSMVELHALVAKQAGPMDRAPELLFLMGAPTVLWFFLTEQSDFMWLSILIALTAVLSLLGGVLTNVKPKELK